MNILHQNLKALVPVEKGRNNEVEGWLGVVGWWVSEAVVVESKGYWGDGVVGWWDGGVVEGMGRRGGWVVGWWSGELVG